MVVVAGTEMHPESFSAYLRPLQANSTATLLRGLPI